MKKISFGLALLIAVVWLPVYAGHTVSYVVAVPAFNEIHAGGHGNVVILGSRRSTQPRVTMTAVSSTSSRPQVHVSQGVLYLLGSAAASRSTVVVRTPDLQKLVVGGSVHVTGTLQPLHALSITAAGSGTVVLNGVVRLHRVQQSGNSVVHIRWVNSDVLLLEGQGHSRMELAGVAKRLYARLTDDAVLHAQYLRTQAVQVQTKNHAIAHVCPIDALRAFASQGSRIYYYKFPIDILRYTTQSGSVLQMAWNE